MRHRKRGRVLGRCPSHQRAMLRNLASALFLTERETYEGDLSVPKVKGRIITTLIKAKEVRPLVERCITIAKKGLVAQEAARPFATQAERGTQEWKAWRKSDKWKKWAQAIAPEVHARRRALQMLGDKEAVRVLFAVVAPRFTDRPGGYTRILKLAKPRLGDAGPRAILEFVGMNDRRRQKAQAPAFETSASS
ncbi:MAG: 50S ribosomal protein L17 [Pirellulales bacterium]|nr:50S ribosomal protein L17 [Pirellulales bacterium]